MRDMSENWTPKYIGDPRAILAMLRSAGFTWRPATDPAYAYGVSDGRLILGDESEILAEQAKLPRDSHGYYLSEPLCKWQQKAHSKGWMPASVSDNIYGWAVGSTLRANLGGGQWAMTCHGLTLEEAIYWATKWVHGAPNRTVAIPLVTLRRAGVDTRALLEV